MLLNNTFLHMTLEKYNLPEDCIVITDLSAHAFLSSKMTKEQLTDFCTIINEAAKTSPLEIEKVY